MAAPAAPVLTPGEPLILSYLCEYEAGGCKGGAGCVCVCRGGGLLTSQRMALSYLVPARLDSTGGPVCRRHMRGTGLTAPFSPWCHISSQSAAICQSTPTKGTETLKHQPYGMYTCSHMPTLPTLLCTHINYSLRAALFLDSMIIA